MSRIYPLHVAVISISLLVYTIQNISWPWRAYWMQEELLVHRWWLFKAPSAAINGPDWALSTELAVWIVFPLLAVLTLWNVALSLIVFIAAIAGVIFVASEHAWSLDVAMANSPLPLLRCVCEFSLGMIVSRFYDNIRLLKPDRAIVIFVMLLFISLLLQIDPFSAFLILIILVILANNKGKLAEQLSEGLLYRIGQLSFTIYMVQLPVILAASCFSEKFESGTSRLISYLIFIVIALTAFVPIAHREIEDRVREKSDKILIRIFS